MLGLILNILCFHVSFHTKDGTAAHFELDIKASTHLVAPAVSGSGSAVVKSYSVPVAVCLISPLRLPLLAMNEVEKEVLAYRNGNLSKFKVSWD